MVVLSGSRGSFLRYIKGRRYNPDRGLAPHRETGRMGTVKHTIIFFAFALGVMSDAIAAPPLYGRQR
jgi:hypothetical protein